MGMGKRRDERMLPGPGRGGSQDRLLSRGHNQREEFGEPGSRDRRGGSQEPDGGRRDRDSSRSGREDNRGGRGGREEGGKPRGAERDTRQAVEDLSKDRDGREREQSRSDSAKGPLSGRREAGAISQTSTSSRIVSRLRVDSSKEESPGLMRGESSLAAVFDQTETRAASLGAPGSKKRPTKSFGGKKSPKKTSEDSRKAEDKRSGSGSLTSKGGRTLERSKELSRPQGKKVTPSRDSSKGDSKAGGTLDTSLKDRVSPASHRSADSLSKSSKRSSRSPLDSKQEVAPDSGRKFLSKNSQSPAPSPSPGPGAAEASGGRKKVDGKDGDAQKIKEAERGNRKGKPEAPSTAKVKRSPRRTRRKSSDSIESLPAQQDGGDIAAAMLGDGLEDGQQDVFSDWSDDDDQFNNIMEDAPRKHHVEDLDDALEFGFGARNHGHREGRNRRGSPSIGDPAPDNFRIMHHSMDQMDHAGAGLGHHDLQGFGRVRDFQHHHGAANRYFGGEDMSPGGSHVDPGMAGVGAGVRGHAGPGKVDELLKPALEKNIPDVKIVEDVQKEKPARERRRRNTGEEGYEEISSDENDLDEEGEKIPKRTIVSILDLDMSSLAQTAHPARSQSPSMSGRPAVFQRYKACSVFSQLGVSRHLLGEKLYAQVQQACQKQLEQDEATLTDSKVKPTTAKAEDLTPSKPTVDTTTISSQVTVGSLQSSTSVTSSATMTVKPEVVTASDSSSTPQTSENSEVVKTDQKEAVTGDTKPCLDSVAVTKQIPSVDSEAATSTVETCETMGKSQPEFKLFADTPAEHIMKKARAQARSSLIGSFGIFRRALTARKDLDIRRQLCKIDRNYDQSAIYPSGLVDPDLFRMSLQLLRQKKAAMMAATGATARVS